MSTSFNERCRVLLSIALLLPAGCTTDLSLPATARIQCDTAADCPGDDLCNPNTHLCIARQSPDTQVPSVVPPVTVSPTIAGPVATVEVVFSVSEPLPQVPGVTFESGGETRTLTYVVEVDGEQPTYTFSYTPVGDEAQGVALPLSIDMADANENRLSGELGAAASDATTGAFTLSLPPLDRKVAVLMAVDKAGNASTPARVRDVRWVATLGQKIPGSSLENPNRWLATSRFMPTWEQPDSREPDVTLNLARVDCAGGVCLPLGTMSADGLGSWHADGTLGDGYTFRPRTGMAVAYDPNTGGILAFGGTDDVPPYAYYNDTWRLDDRGWTQVDPPLVGTPQASPATAPIAARYLRSKGPRPTAGSTPRLGAAPPAWRRSPSTRTTPRCRVSSGTRRFRCTPKSSATGTPVTASGSTPSPTAIAALSILKPSYLEGVAVRFDAGGTGAGYDPARELVLYDQGSCGLAGGFSVTFDSDTLPTYPKRDDLAVLLGSSPNRRWELAILSKDNNTYDGTLTQWSLALNGGAPTTRTANVLLKPGQGYADAIDLSAATLPALTRVVVTITIANTSYPFCSSGFTAKPRTTPVGGTPVDGVELYGFGASGWELMASDSGSATSPGKLVWTSANAADGSRFVYGADRLMRFAVAPEGSNGMRPVGATVTTDYAEVDVHYRLPP